MFDMNLISDDELHDTTISMSFVPSIGTILKIANTKYRVYKVQVEVDNDADDNICMEVITLVLEKI